MSGFGPLDVYDNQNGSMKLSWGAPSDFAAQSYNVYVNGVLNQNVATLNATVTGLTKASYNGTTETPSGTYTFNVTAVSGGVEKRTISKKVTVSPTNIMLTTPMRRPWPFPTMTPGG
jgi:hypothetical protein